MINLLITLLLYLISTPLLNAEPLVQISQGILNGTILKSRNGRNYSAFRGIPYGKPPEGILRFKNPAPADKWNGIRQAKSFRSPCLHTFFGFMIIGKEDCLHLNVYSPFLEFQENLKYETPNDTLLPVMMWIHGGSFFFGGSNDVSAEYILDKDVILVTINYRLGILGFLSTGDSEAPGNFGMKDQVLALKWVQENIKAFGGDRNRVTIFGISSGSACVHLHALSKATNGLFNQYIMQSGTALGSWAYRDSRDIFESVKKIANFVSCPTTSTKSLLSCLRKQNGKMLVFWSGIVGLFIRGLQITWVPTNEPDFVDAFLTDSPENLMDQMKDMPFISGVVADESIIITNVFYSVDIFYHLIKKFAKNLIIDDAVYINGAQKGFAVNLDEFYFNNSCHSIGKIEELDRYTALLSDGLIIYPEMRMLDKITPKMKNPNFVYKFGYRGKILLFSNLLSNDNFGVGHGNDLVFLFPITYTLFNRADKHFSTTDRKISKLMVDLWTSFASNGVPTSQYLDPPNLWKPYNTENNTYLQIGNTTNNMEPSVSLENDFFTERMNFWRQHFPFQLQEVPLNRYKMTP